MSARSFGGRLSRALAERAPEVALAALVLLVAAALAPEYTWPLLLVGLALMLLAIVGGFRFRALRGLQTARLERARSQSKALERKLERRQEAMDALTEGLDQLVFVCDPDTQVRYANAAARGFFRFDDPTGQQLVGVTLSAEIDRLLRHCIDTGVRQTQEVRLSHPRESTVIARAWPQREERDRFIVSINDVTELRRLETVRRDFVANVSHEMRTPMTSVRAMAETMQEVDDPELRKRFLQNTIIEMDRLTQITEDLLTLGAAESTQRIRERVDLAALARDAVEQLLPRATEKGLELSIETQPAVVNANEREMEQVCLNLIANAINYTAAGTVNVEVSTDGETAKLVVKDTGIGIAAEHQSRIFERFYRVDKGRSRQSGGTGLGLSIVRHIVESHDGEVEVQSALNQGSALTVTLPLGS